MATDLVVCKVYDVGQGACNFIEIYDSTDHSRPAYTILIDCGSVLVHDAAKEAVKQIAATLSSMTTPTIDSLILTHSDVDHINFVLPLLNNFEPPDAMGEETKLGINRIYFGGAQNHYSKRGKNILTHARKYLNGDQKENLIAAGPDQMGYNETDMTWTPFRTVGGVDLSLLAGNTTTAQVDIFSGKTVGKANKGYLRNMVSLVVMVKFDNVYMIFTGDGTALTMARCNQVLAKSGPLDGTFMVTLPHHGSEDTALNLLGLQSNLDRTALAEQNVAQFVGNIHAETATTSAERHRTYHHPSSKLLNFFWSSLTVDQPYYVDDAIPRVRGRHFYTAYFTKDQYNAADPADDENTMHWPPSKNWYTAQTAANVFTTMYFLLDRQNSGSNQWCAILPPKEDVISGASLTKTDPKRSPPTPYVGVTWKFSIQENGYKSVAPLVQRKLSSAGLPIGILGLSAPPLSAPALAGAAGARPRLQPRPASNPALPRLARLP
jgi:hypothetical protein